MKVYCPNCGASEEVAASRPGSRADCKSCSASFLVRVRLDAETSRSVAPLYMWFVRKVDGSLISFPGAEQLYRAVVGGLVDRADELSADGRTWAPVTSMPVLARLVGHPGMQPLAPTMPSEVRRALTPDRLISEDDNEPTRTETVLLVDGNMLLDSSEDSQEIFSEATTPTSASTSKPSSEETTPFSSSSDRNVAKYIEPAQAPAAPQAVQVPVAPPHAAPPVPPGPPPPSSASNPSMQSMLDEIQKRASMEAMDAVAKSRNVGARPVHSQAEEPAAAQRPPAVPPPPAPLPPAPAPVASPSAQSPSTPSRSAYLSAEDLESPLAQADLGDADWDRIEPSSPRRKRENTDELEMWTHELAIRRRNRLLGALGALVGLLLLLVTVKVCTGPKEDPGAEKSAAEKPASEAQVAAKSDSGPGSGGPSEGAASTNNGSVIANQDSASADVAETKSPEKVQEEAPEKAPLAKAEDQTPQKPARTGNPEFRPLTVPTQPPVAAPLPAATLPDGNNKGAAASRSPETNGAEVNVAEVKGIRPDVVEPKVIPPKAQPKSEPKVVEPKVVKPKSEPKVVEPKVVKPKTPEPPRPPAEPEQNQGEKSGGTAAADKLRDAGRFADAAVLYEQILKSQGGSASLHLKLADCYRKTNNCEKAIPHFNKAISMGHSKSAYVGAARCYNATGDADKAVELLKEGLKQGEDKVMRTLLKQYGGE